MTRALKIFRCATLFILMLQCTLWAQEDLVALTDKFYDGLADIIEQNMDNPDRCLEEVNNYYTQNRETVERIRGLSEKYMKEAFHAMKKYESMSDEELEALAREGERLNNRTQHIPTGTARYTTALDAFTSSHPRHAMEIAFKAMQLVPRNVVTDTQ